MEKAYISDSVWNIEDKSFDNKFEELICQNNSYCSKACLGSCQTSTMVLSNENS